MSGERLDFVGVMDIADVGIVEAVSKVLSELAVSIVLVVVEIVVNAPGNAVAVSVGCVSSRAPDTESQIR